MPQFDYGKGNVHKTKDQLQIIYRIHHDKRSSYRGAISRGATYKL